MPPKGKSYKKGAKRYKKKTYKNKSRMGKPSAGLTTSVYKFRRQKLVRFNFGGVMPDGWSPCTDHTSCIYRSWMFTAADDITGWNEFQQLFQQYKIDGVRLQLYPDGNTITTQRDQPQFIMMTIPTRHGYAPTSREALLQHQALKKKIVFNQAQPLEIYMKMKQASAVYSSSDVGNPQYTDYTATKPKFIATEEPNANHYGFTTYLQTANDTSFTTGSWTAVAISMYVTVYFTMKGVA